eukprot:CAMPEP_0116848890 /NCGR_PEP_ID=MMETSP0418-20121206/15263_1 /TAXON_ID=1158023 /ORGANISM="Astrosyne radiata, Strain 13vi08-1A" /LENGTH=182 /DNA_ID=CAMNT_0004480541 /DNA_START=773 /DNA_END=1321 /DNA_ORIENTATION=+
MTQIIKVTKYHYVSSKHFSIPYRLILLSLFVVQLLSCKGPNVDDTQSQGEADDSSVLGGKEFNSDKKLPLPELIMRHMSLFRESVLCHEFGNAERHLNSLRRLSRHLPKHLQPVLGLSELENKLREYKEQYEALERFDEREKRTSKELDEAMQEFKKLAEATENAVKEIEAKDIDLDGCIIS